MQAPVLFKFLDSGIKIDFKIYIRCEAASTIHIQQPSEFHLFLVVDIILLDTDTSEMLESRENSKSAGCPTGQSKLFVNDAQRIKM